MLSSWPISIILARRRANNEQTDTLGSHQKLKEIECSKSDDSPTNRGLTFDELCDRALKSYSDQCLEVLACGLRPNELYDGVKKTIAARILGSEKPSNVCDTTEDHINASIDSYCKKFIQDETDPETSAKLNELRSFIAKPGSIVTNFDKIIATIHSLKLEEQIPDEIIRSESDAAPGSTSPTKNRAKSKKAQQSVIVSREDGVKRHLEEKYRQMTYVFTTVMQHMFVNLSYYFKNMRSRIIINSSSPLLDQIDQDLLKEVPSKASRSKSNSAKRLKLDLDLSSSESSNNSTNSPLLSEQSKLMDSKILLSLLEAKKCLDFLNSDFGSFNKIWLRYCANNKALDRHWYRRFSIDTMFINGQHDGVISLINSFFESKAENQESEKMDQSALEQVDHKTIIKPSHYVSQMRSLAQLISSHVQSQNRDLVYDNIENLIGLMKQCGIVNRESPYDDGNVIDEYRIPIHHEEFNGLCFLFFDQLSLIRYCLDILRGILKRYAMRSNISDSVIGHTIVVSQVDWPKEARTYNDCVSWIRKNKPKSTTAQCLSAATKFTYPEFFCYIHNPTMIEDFMAMVGQGYTLDIRGGDPTRYLPNSASSLRNGNSYASQPVASVKQQASSGSSTRSGKAITTRGVNKTFKEDLKVAMIAQMKVSSIMTPLDVVSDFITSSLLPFIRSES